MGGLIYALAKLGIYQSGQAKPYQTGDDSKGGGRDGGAKL